MKSSILWSLKLSLPISYDLFLFITYSFHYPSCFCLNPSISHLYFSCICALLIVFGAHYLVKLKKCLLFKMLNFWLMFLYISVYCLSLSNYCFKDFLLLMFTFGYMYSVCIFDFIQREKKSLSLNIENKP